MTIAERILDEIRFGPLDDDVLARRLGVSRRQSVNTVARQLEAQGRLRRHAGPDGKLVNELVPDSIPPGSSEPEPLTEVGVDRLAQSGWVAEDVVKRAVQQHLESLGFAVSVAWGRTRGIDLDARHRDGRRYVVEAKGGVASSPQQVNYFLGALGELVQRMSDPDACYGLALPDNKQYRGLVDRLPRLARTRLGLVVFWVSSEQEVRLDQPDDA